MEEVVDKLQCKKELTGCNGRPHLPAVMEKVVDHLQWKMSLTFYNGKGLLPVAMEKSWRDAMEDVDDLLRWKK